MDDGLKNRAIRGAAWVGLSQAGGRFISFLVTAVLARFLTPDDFGLIGMVLIFSGFASLFNEMGFRAALIQKQDVNEGHFSSVFWFNIIVSILLMLLMTLSAPLIADFFKKTELAQLVRLLSLTFLIGSPVIVMRAQFAKELNFRGLSIIQLIAAAASGVLGVSLALLGYGVYALVGQLLGSAACYTILIWVYSDWRPRWLFSWSAIRELMGFSIGVIGGNSLNYWVRNADKLLIGKFLGAANLGLYSMAYTIMSLPMSQITTVLAKVMFPTLSVIQAHRGRTRMIYLRSIAVIGLLAFPAMLGLIVVADDFVIAIFGEQWQEMIPTLRLLCLGGLLQSVNSTVGWIYKSQGRSDIQFWWILFNGILTFIAVGIGINWGINGVAIAYAVRIFLTTWLNFYIPGRLINMSFGDVAKALLPQLLIAIVMAVILAYSTSVIPETWPHILRLGVLIAIGSFVFFILIRQFQIPAYTDVIRLAKEGRVNRSQ